MGAFLGGVVTFIQTADRARAAAFYRDVLGLPHRGFDGFAELFDLDGASLRVTEIPGFKPAPHPALGWKVADIAASVAALKGAGIEMKRFPGLELDADGVWTAPGGAAKVAWFDDPDGNLLSLTQA